MTFAVEMMDLWMFANSNNGKPESNLHFLPCKSFALSSYTYIQRTYIACHLWYSLNNRIKVTDRRNSIVLSSPSLRRQMLMTVSFQKFNLFMLFRKCNLKLFWRKHFEWSFVMFVWMFRMFRMFLVHGVWLRRIQYILSWAMRVFRALLFYYFINSFLNQHFVRLIVTVIS